MTNAAAAEVKIQFAPWQNENGELVLVAIDSRNRRVGERSIPRGDAGEALWRAIGELGEMTVQLLPHRHYNRDLYANPNQNPQDLSAPGVSTAEAEAVFLEGPAPENISGNPPFTEED